MKIRTGFVSNSSSSSFCILGYGTSLNEISEIFDIPDKLVKHVEIEKISEIIYEHAGFYTIISSEDPEYAFVGFDVEGKTIAEILELAIQPDDNDKISALKIKMMKSTEPRIISGEVDY